MELIEAIRWWPLWAALGLKDIQRRYRRTVLGPFWLTLSMGLMIGTLGVLYSELWKTSIERMLPFVSAGIITWVLITSLATEGCAAFTESETTIKQLRFPYLVCMFRILWRNTIVLFHNLIIQVMVLLFIGPFVSWHIALVVPGLLLVLINGGWFIVLAGLLCTRFRDIAQVVASLLTILMFVTPIFWFPEQAGIFRVYFVEWNIFYHMIELVRRPLLGEIPATMSYAFVGATAVVGWAFTAIVYSRYRRMIPFWL